jgi:hypothetical protein
VEGVEHWGWVGLSSSRAEKIPGMAGDERAQRALLVTPATKRVASWAAFSIVRHD